MRTRVKLSHWLPIITRCPLSIIPDFVYVELHIEDNFVELYDARKKLRKLLSWRCSYMEDLAARVLDAFPGVNGVTVRLMFNIHSVTVTR